MAVKKKLGVGPVIVIVLILLSFVPWCVSKTMPGDAAAGWLSGVSPAVSEYLLLTWLPTLGNVLTVGLVLYIFGWPMVVDMIRSRKHEIEHSIEEAARVKAQSELDYNEAEKRLDNLDSEVAELRESYTRAVREERERISEETARAEVRLEKDADVVFELQSNVSKKLFEREVMSAALDKARAEICTRLAADASLRDRLIDQGIASLELK